MLPLSISPAASFSSLNDMINNKRATSFSSDKDDRIVIRSPKELLHDLLKNIESAELRHAMRNEIRRLINDHERLVSMLQQRSHILENENHELRHTSSEHQHRYEKAVREMQFFRRHNESKQDDATERQHQQQKKLWERSYSIVSEASFEPLVKQPSYPLTPTSPFPLPSRSISGRRSAPPTPSYNLANNPSPSPSLPPHRATKISTVGSRSSSCSDSSATSYSSSSHYWLTSGYTPGSPPEPAPPVPPLYKAKNRKLGTDNMRQKPATATMIVTPTPSIHSAPMTPVRSSTSTNGYTGGALIQQRRVDPLTFGGSDGLWDTLAKHQGSDVTVEKTITNFLRRGGSPNTAKQAPSATTNAIKYGYGMIHALIVTKASTPLDLLLQQGANPNAMTLSHLEGDKVTPCYLAAAVGWLAGLQKLVQAGGDLVAARGAGVKNKTPLHVAAEHCHAAVVEYVVSVTHGALNLEQDSDGATVLHYACASGHTDLVSFLTRNCQIPVDEPDNRGELPLHWAARHGCLEVVSLLVERCGCDVNAYVPHRVGTPMDLAKAAGQRRLVDYLKGMGALTTKKMDKRREEVPKKAGLENRLAKNGFGMFFVGESTDNNSL